MLHKIDDSTKFLNKRFFSVVKLEIQNLIITLLLFFFSLTLIIAPVLILINSSNFSLLIITLFFSLVIFLILYNGKRVAYFSSVNHLRKTGVVQFAYYMESYVKSLRRCIGISLYQTAFFLLSILIFFILMRTFNLDISNQFTGILFIFIFLLFFIVNELILVPILIVMSVTDKDFISSFKLYVKKIVVIISKRLLYIVVLTITAVLTTLFSFMLFPPLLFMLVLYPILILSHIGDIREVVSNI
ncbi:MAG: hypothetical protein N3E37_03505 [Candidatus Micrarchaeota archaeon]|nr:hypothetical protein [Candidatus Micrarchaeota archaeon]